MVRPGSERTGPLSPEMNRSPYIERHPAHNCDSKQPGCWQAEPVWTIRTAEPADRDAILDMVYRAFNGPDHDGGEEVAIVRDTGHLGAVIDGLELVADEDGLVVGHVLGARGDLSGRDVLAIAPLAVAPERQGQGVGSALVSELLQRADTHGWPLAVLLGDPRYYGRFGFEAAGPYGIVYRPVGADNPHFQVRRLASYDPIVRGEVQYCWEIGTG